MATDRGYTVVVKLGSSVLTAGGNQLNRPAMLEVVRQCFMLQQAGHHVIVVSSGGGSCTLRQPSPACHYRQQTAAGRSGPNPADSALGGAVCAIGDADRADAVDPSRSGGS
jgi:glutamate 5-kinase